jgi:hypothetical protein
MTLRLYFNHNVPEQIVAGLRRRDVDCLTALEDHAERLPDPELLRRSTQLNRVLFTMDDDLYRVTAHALEAQVDFSGVIYAHPLKITIGQAVNDLELMAKALDWVDMANRLDRIPL